MTGPQTMRLAEIQALIADSRGEGEHIEFKNSTGELHAGMETLCGFLNGAGGMLLFGVNTAGRVHGQDVADATLQEIANAIRKLEPAAWIEQTRIPFTGTKEVIMVRDHVDGTRRRLREICEALVFQVWIPRLPIVERVRSESLRGSVCRGGSP